MESHTHPPYEETFNRIATILDVIAGSQAEHADEMAEIRDVQLNQSKILEQTQKILADQVGASHRLTQAMEKLMLKSAETEEKLNALITLMDQHLSDHRHND
jgi:septal ring factor EnvC (AmiA/AmiB activator)